MTAKKIMMVKPVLKCLLGISKYTEHDFESYLFQKSAARELHATSEATSVESICKRTPTNSDSLPLKGTSAVGAS